MSISIVILAGGQGTRMGTDIPKLLHQIAGEPIVKRVLNSCLSFSGSSIFVVYNPNLPELVQYLEKLASEIDITLVPQTESLGTGHALQQALPILPDNQPVVVLAGDVPLITPRTISQLVERCQNGLSLVTQCVDNPQGLGRIIRDKNQQPCGIVEDKDASQEQKAIKEINSAIYAFSYPFLCDALPLLQSTNAQSEFYLTDVLQIAYQLSLPITAIAPEFSAEVLGVNTLSELSRLERLFQVRTGQQLMDAGVKILDPMRFDMRGTLKAGRNVEIDINVLLEGRVELGDNVTIGPNVYIKDAFIGSGTVVKAFSHIEGAEIGHAAQIGPYARVRPGTKCESQVKIGNFVEIKGSNIGLGTKISHLSYVGDAEIGNGVNIGAGTITCNYNGVSKSKTKIDDNAFVGSNVTLVAPVSIGSHAYIGAGSTITKTAPSEQLTLSRTKQQTVHQWKPPKEQQSAAVDVKK